MQEEERRAERNESLGGVQGPGRWISEVQATQLRVSIGKHDRNVGSFPAQCVPPGRRYKAVRRKAMAQRRPESRATRPVALELLDVVRLRPQVGPDKDEAAILAEQLRYVMAALIRMRYIAG